MWCLQFWPSYLRLLQLFRLFVVPQNFGMTLFLKNIFRILIGIALNLQMTLGHMHILTILILLIQEHEKIHTWTCITESLYCTPETATTLLSPMCCAVLSRSVVSNSLQPVDCSPVGSSVQGDYPDKNTRVGCHAHLQGIFPTQISNPDLPHCRWVLYHLSHQGSPRILERVAYPFSRGTSRPRNWTRDSCIAGRFFTSWATREVQSPIL